MRAADLPFFLGFMQHLAHHGFPSATPIPNRQGRLIGELRYSPERRKITSLVLVSEEARYVWYWEGKPLPRRMAIVVESQP